MDLMKRRIRNIVIFTITVCILLVLTMAYPANVSAADDGDSPSVTYNLNEEPQFTGRTKADVAEQYSDAMEAGATYDRNDSSTFFINMPSTEAPYAAGQMTSDTLLAMHEMTNFYRWLVGVEPLIDPCVHSDELQAGALVRCFDFNHTVDPANKPADMDDALWELGANADHSILSLGCNPHGSITNWMNEGYNLYDNSFDTFGHRNSLIGKRLSNIQFGYVDSVAIGLDQAYNNENKALFYAFPSPGCVPTDLVWASGCGWQVVLDRTRVSNPSETSNVKVTVVNLRTGKSWTRTVADSTLKIGGDAIYFAQPDDAENGQYNDSYHVTISGLVDVATESSATVEYTVDFMDITNDVRSYVSFARPEYNELTIYESLKDTQSLKKIAAVLPSEVIVTADSGMKCTLPVEGKWILDEKNHCYRNTADKSKLPENLNDKKNVLQNIKVPYTISDDYYDQYNSLSIYEDDNWYYDDILEGKDAVISIHRTMISSDTSRVFRILDNGDGTYSGELRLDSATSENFSREDAYDKYIMKNVTSADAGEYVSIYFNSEWGGEAYVSTSIVPLVVVRERNNDSEGTDDEAIDISGTDAVEVYGVKNKTYTGKAMKQKPTITLWGYPLEEGIDYQLSYKNNVNVGKATMIIKGINDCTGTIKKTFKINPKGTSIKKLTKGKKAFTVKWAKQSAKMSKSRITGYEVRYSLKKNMAGAKTKVVKGYSKTSLKVKKLKAKKTFYVQVRTYMNVDGSKYVSAWSGKKKVKTK